MRQQKLENVINVTIPFAPSDEFEEIDKAIMGAQEYVRRNLGVMISSMNLSLETLNIGLTVEHGTIKVHIVERYSNEGADE